MKVKNVAILVLSFVLPQSLSANEMALSPLKGSSYGEVLNLLGPPKEKEIREAKREDLWIYDKQNILFREGKVVETDLGAAAPITPVPVKAKKSVAKSSDEVDRILKDLVTSK